MSGRLIQLCGIVVDLVHTIERLPAPGEECESHTRLICAGGGFNAMAAASRFGAPVVYAGTLGRGRFADIADAALVEEGIARVSSLRAERDQGSSVVLVDASAERSFVSWHGAERDVTDALLRDIDAHADDWLLLSGYSLYKPDNAARYLAWLADLPRYPQGPQVMFDPGPIIEDLPQRTLEAMLARCDWISCNAREAQTLVMQGDAATAADRLAADRQGAIVRCGAQGCLVATAGARTVSVPGLSVAAIDTTGAGDAHVGAFIAARLLGWSVPDAARLANASAAIATTEIGSAQSVGLDEARALLHSSGMVVASPAPGVDP